MTRAVSIFIPGHVVGGQHVVPRWHVLPEQVRLACCDAAVVFGIVGDHDFQKDQSGKSRQRPPAGGGFGDWVDRIDDGGGAVNG